MPHSKHTSPFGYEMRQRMKVYGRLQNGQLSGSLTSSVYQLSQRKLSTYPQFCPFTENTR